MNATNSTPATELTYEDFVTMGKSTLEVIIEHHPELSDAQRALEEVRKKEAIRLASAKRESLWKAWNELSDAAHTLSLSEEHDVQYEVEALMDKVSEKYKVAQAHYFELVQE